MHLKGRPLRHLPASSLCGSAAISCIAQPDLSTKARIPGRCPGEASPGRRAAIGCHWLEWNRLISPVGSVSRCKQYGPGPGRDDAVKQWRYRPAMLNGVPVESMTPITVNFSMN